MKVSYSTQIFSKSMPFFEWDKIINNYKVDCNLNNDLCMR